MNFIKYCELPENEAWITQMMWKMKLDTGFDEQALIEAVEEQAELDGIALDTEVTGQSLDYGADYEQFFATQYDELGDPQDGPYPRSGAI